MGIHYNNSKKIVAMHQPHYLPWLGYFHKIGASDIFIFLDNVQYEKNGFQNRNKIRTSAGARWLTVPVITKGASTQKLKDVLIDTTQKWQKSHWGMMSSQYKEAPYFAEHADFFSGVYSQKWEKLVALNMEIITYFLEYLGIKNDILMENELEIDSMQSQRIIDICKKLGADTYLSGAGAKEYLEEDKFIEAGIKLAYQDFTHPVYRQQYMSSENDFIPFMSMVDLLFNEGPNSSDVLGLHG
jgi:hypothetical protein